MRSRETTTSTCLIAAPGASLPYSERQPLGADRLVGVEQREREDAARLAASQRHNAPLVLQRPRDCERHGFPANATPTFKGAFSASQSACNPGSGIFAAEMAPTPHSRPSRTDAIAAHRYEFPTVRELTPVRLAAKRQRARVLASLIAVPEPARSADRR